MNKLKEILEQTITLFTSIIVLCCCVIWFLQSKEIEPLIGIITSISIIIISIFIKIQSVNEISTTEENKNNPINSEIQNSKNIIVGANINVKEGDFRVGDNINQ